MATSKTGLQQVVSVIVRAVNQREFEAELAQLLHAFGGAEQNPGSYKSDRCEGCINCMFCLGCDHCYRCTHCTDCQACTASSHCARCIGCHDSSHCEDTQASTASAYLTKCSFCNECTYCYGCVGLNKKEFHILNKPYSRSDYFALVKALRGK